LLSFGAIGHKKHNPEQQIFSRVDPENTKDFKLGRPMITFQQAEQGD